MIQWMNVTFQRENRRILDQINLTMNDGEHWVILGRNGSGKTTMLEMLNGYLFPSKGKMEVLGYPYGRCDVREARKEIGYISQSLVDKMNLSDPVWEIVAAGQYGFLRFYEEVPVELKEKAVEHLDKVNIKHLSEQPLGILSQGERKKVLLARALMSSPKLLVMDEPCAGLDLYEREKLLQDLEGFHQENMQMIYVTHHMEEIMPVFTHVILLHEGKIVAAGKKKEVLTQAFLEQAYEVQVNIDWQDDRPWIRVLK